MLLISVNPTINSTQTILFSNWGRQRRRRVTTHLFVVVSVSVRMRMKPRPLTTTVVDGGNVLPPYWSAIHFELLADGREISAINCQRFQKLLPLQKTGARWGIVATLCCFQSGFLPTPPFFKQNTAPVSRAAAVPYKLIRYLINRIKITGSF